MWYSNGNTESKTQPRPLVLVGGLLLLLFAVVFLWVGINLAIGLRSEPSALKAVIAALSLYTSISLLVFSWRLILNRPHPDRGLLSSTSSNATINRIQETLSQLQQKYPITDTWSGEKGEFKVRGIEDTFYIDFLSHDHCILSNNYSWHEHFTGQSGDLYGLDGPYSLEEFLDGLFTGTIQIMVKYRGKTPVAHEV